MKDYETLLQKLEQDIREHISIEHQLKIQCEKFAENIDNLEEEKILLLSQIVRIFNIIILLYLQDDERKEFNEQLKELTKQIDDFLKQKNNFQEIEKNYKIQLENKDQEIIQLNEKIKLLNKNIKNLENKLNNNINEEKKNLIINSNIHINQEELNDHKKFNYSLSQQNFKAVNIKNMKNQSNNNNSSINNKITLYNQNLQNQKKFKFNNKKLLLRNMSANNIDSYNIDNSNKKSLISNYNNKNSSINSINETIGNYIYKLNENESDLNSISRDNSYNLKRTNNNNSKINSNKNNKFKLKLPVNITNNNYNMNKNNVMINLSTNIVSNNIQLEKLKVQQKLVEYRKLIDKKIDELMNNKKRNRNQKKNISPKNYEIYKNASVSSLHVDFTRKHKKKINSISKTNYKYLNKDYFKNLHDKNIILPKKISGNDNKTIIHSNSQKIISFNRIHKKKLNIATKNIKNEKWKFNINNYENDKVDNKIHEQITSKGNDEEKSEDSKH